MLQPWFPKRSRALKFLKLLLDVEGAIVGSVVVNLFAIQNLKALEVLTPTVKPNLNLIVSMGWWRHLAEMGMELLGGITRTTCNWGRGVCRCGIEENKMNC